MSRPASFLCGILLSATSVLQSAIVPAPDATHVLGVDDRTVRVAAGSTYSFTVDTPENKGLVSTVPDVEALLGQLTARGGAKIARQLVGVDDRVKTTGVVADGDKLSVTAVGGSISTYALKLDPAAVGGRLSLEPEALTVNATSDLTLHFTAGQRSPDATVRISVPAGIQITPDNTTVNVIGRGDVTLRDLPRQSIGRTGSAYSYSKVGEVEIAAGDDGTVLTFKHLDLRPANGTDLKLVIRGVKLSRPGEHVFNANYTTAQPEALTSAGIGAETARLAVLQTVADFRRLPARRENASAYTSVDFKWSPVAGTMRLEHSVDEGRTWRHAPTARLDVAAGTAHLDGLEPDRRHAFRLQVTVGAHVGVSPVAGFHSGRVDIKSFGATGDGRGDDTDRINAAIAHLADLGGGTLRFSDGVYRVRTVRLRSNVWLYVDRGATILALKGGDAPEPTWFSDRKYRSGLSPTDAGPYENPDNWLTKQDVGHTYFRNTMFFGERLDNVKIVGNGRISGDGNLVTGDRVMNNPPDNRSDKMFTFKLCTNIEIGGLPREGDLWYDPARDEPYYRRSDGTPDHDTGNMLQIDRGGHFVLLATGTDGIDIHDAYHGRHHTGNSRDLYDFMQCNDVVVTNLYCKVSSDDIVKLGSDCSLGFTRPVRGYRVRNIVGDTNCNLFQIGSETADDIMDVHVDNIYVLGANKAGFSISTNDGAHVKDIHLNCGHTGPLHSRSKMLRTHTPFFISISNRARVLGATVGRFKFNENGTAHDELLATNINIGIVENILLNAIDVTEQYAGSSYRNASERWKPYDGTQRKAAPIVAGYKLPDPADVEGGLDFRLPNGEHTGRIRHIVFNDVHFLAKGGSPASDAVRQPPELGVGQYNASNLGVLPAYGLYARHVADLRLTNVTFNHEQRDGTPAVVLDDVVGASLDDVQLVRATAQPEAIQLRESRDVRTGKVTVYTDDWGKAPQELPALR